MCDTLVVRITLGQLQCRLLHRQVEGKETPRYTGCGLLSVQATTDQSGQPAERTNTHVHTQRLGGSGTFDASSHDDINDMVICCTQYNDIYNISPPQARVIR